MTAALDAGADPNELDHELYNICTWRCLGRPLHCCLGGFNAWGPPSIIRFNPLLIQLLLSRGADPRLPGPRQGPEQPSPLAQLARQKTGENAELDDWEKTLL